MVRLGIAGAVLGALLYGTVLGQDRDFPFGPMVQYAFYVNPNGEIDDTYLLARTAMGVQLRVDPTVDTIGVNRAQIEGQLGDFRSDPVLLARIAAAHTQRRPGEPRWTWLSLRQHVHVLHRGRIVRTDERTIATWSR